MFLMTGIEQVQSAEDDREPIVHAPPLAHLPFRPRVYAVCLTFHVVTPESAAAMQGRAPFNRAQIVMQVIEDRDRERQVRERLAFSLL